MKTTYYNLKSELTERMDKSVELGFDVYRTRTTCGCTARRNRRNAVLVVNGNVIVWKLIRCKACRKEVGDGC